MSRFFVSFPSRVETIDGSANEGEDYEKVDEVLTFEPDEREKEVRDEREEWERKQSGDGIDWPG